MWVCFSLPCKYKVPEFGLGHQALQDWMAVCRRRRRKPAPAPAASSADRESDGSVATPAAIAEPFPKAILELAEARDLYPLVFFKAQFRKPFLDVFFVVFFVSLLLVEQKSNCT